MIFTELSGHSSHAVADFRGSIEEGPGSGISDPPTCPSRERPHSHSQSRVGEAAAVATDPWPHRWRAVQTRRHWTLVCLNRELVRCAAGKAAQRGIPGCCRRRSRRAHVRDAERRNADCQPQVPTRIEPRLKRAHRLLSASAGSRNRARQRARVARLHRRTAYRRSDFLHKLTTRLVREHDIVCIEDLNVRGLARAKLSASVLDGVRRVPTPSHVQGEMDRQVRGCGEPVLCLQSDLLYVRRNKHEAQNE